MKSFNTLSIPIFSNRKKKILFLFLAGAVICALLIPLTARAQTLVRKSSKDIDYSSYEKKTEAIEEKVKEADDGLSFLRKQYLKYEQESVQARLQKRILEAETYFHGGDCRRAAIILYELVGDPPTHRDADSPTPEIRNENSSEYFEASKLMADSLFKDKNYLAARKYYNYIYTKGGSRYAQDALLKLIQIAGLTENYEDLDAYRNQLERMRDIQVIPEVRYLFGMNFFKKGDMDSALYQLSQIQSGQDFYFKAQYIIGAIHTTQNKFKEALELYERLIAAPPSQKEDSKVIELARLARGRLMYQMTQFDDAQKAYQEVDKNSPYFRDALYETGWSLIRRRKLDAAIKTLDLYILTLEDELKIPHARIVQARLWLRNGNFERASEEMEFIIREYQSAKDDIERIVSLYKDPELYFYQVTGIKPPPESPAAQGEKLPETAVKWASQEPRMKKALVISNDLIASKQGVEDATTFSARISKALTGKNAVDLFDTAKEAKTRAASVEAVLMSSEMALNQIRTELAMSFMSQQEKEALEYIRNQRKELEKAVEKMPKSERDYLERVEQIGGQINRIDEVLVLSLTHLKLLLEKLQAIESNFHSRRSEMAREAEAERNFIERIQDEKKTLLSYETRIGELRSILGDMKDDLGIGKTTQTDSDIRKNYIEAIEKENQLVTKMQERISPEGRAIIARIDNNLQNISEKRKQLNRFNEDLDVLVAKRGGNLRELILAQADQLTRYALILQELQNESEQVAGGIAMNSLGLVRDKFYNILLEANVGLVNIAWEKKDRQTKAINKLVQVKNLELRALDREFAEVREIQ